jgi:hypothetical protein
MPNSAKSEYLELFLLEKEQQKLTKEMDILNNQMELLNKRKNEKKDRLGEINEQIAKVVKSEYMKFEGTSNGKTQGAGRIAGSSRFARGRREEAEKESEDSERRWQTIKLDY